MIQSENIEKKLGEAGMKISQAEWIKVAIEKSISALQSTLIVQDKKHGPLSVKRITAFKIGERDPSIEMSCQSTDPYFQQWHH